MKRGQVFVRAKDVNGRWYSADVLDLDEFSFRAFVVDMLIRAGLVVSLKDYDAANSRIEYQSTVARPDDD